LRFDVIIDQPACANYVQPMSAQHHGCCTARRSQSVCCNSEVLGVSRPWLMCYHNSRLASTWKRSMVYAASNRYNDVSPVM